MKLRYLFISQRLPSIFRYVSLICIVTYITVVSVLLLFFLFVIVIGSIRFFCFINHSMSGITLNY